jgi:hypothetical protein
VQLVLEHERPIVAGAVDERVQIPARIDDAQLEEEAGVRILTRFRMLRAREQPGLRIALRDVEPALLERPAVGTIDGFEGERRRPRERMLLDPDRIVDAVELDGFAERRVTTLVTSTVVVKPPIFSGDRRSRRFQRGR